MDLIKEYFVIGYNLFLDQINLSFSEIYKTFNLVVVLDIVLLFGLFYWIWSKIRGTSLTKVLPGLFGILILILTSKILGLLAFFYALIFLFIVLLVASVLIYGQELQKIVEFSASNSKRQDKIRLLDRHEINNFIKDLTNTIILLSKYKISSLLVIKTNKPVGRLIDNGTALKAPFSKGLVVDIFSHRSGLSSGAIIVDNGTVVAVGSTLTDSDPKKFTFSLSNPVLKQVALHWDAIVIVTYKNNDYISLLHKDNSYSKLSPSSLERVLKTILMSR